MRPVEVAPQPVELIDKSLDLDEHGTNDAQVAGAVLARDRFILDGLGAERALHQAGLLLLRVLIRSSSSRALRNSVLIRSRLRMRSSRSSKQGGGHRDVARAGDADQRPLDVSRWQNGQIIARSGHNLQNEARAGRSAVAVLEIDANHVFTWRHFGVGHVDAGRPDILLHPRCQVDIGVRR
jgi:hypothetical protein